LFRFSRLIGEPKSLGSTRLSGTVHLVATDVLAVNFSNNRLVYVGREWPDNEFRIVSIGQGIARTTTVEPTALRAFFGPASRYADPEFGLLALEKTDFQWAVVSRKEIKVLAKPVGAKVFGVLMDDDRGDHDAGLLTLEDDRQTVTLNGRNWRKEIFRAHAAVEHIALCQREPYIAYSTVHGEIVIYSVQHRSDLCRYFSEGEK